MQKCLITRFSSQLLATIRLLILIAIPVQIIFSATTSWALISSKSLDFYGYFRSAVGTNNLGGKHYCFGLPGNLVPYNSNPMRLGNECGTYGEFGARVNHLKNGAEEPFFFSQFLVNFAPANDTVADAPATAGTNVVEVFGEGGNIGSGILKNASYWIGKRYYRDSDLHIMDTFYIAGITGNGAGISKIDLSFAKLSLAAFFESDTKASSTDNLTATRALSKKGAIQTRNLDARFTDINISKKLKLFAWLAYAYQNKSDRLNSNSTSGTATTTTTNPADTENYINIDGNAIGIRLNFKNDILDNDFAILRGSGILYGFYQNGQVAFTGSSNAKNAKTWRFVDSATLRLGDFQLVANILHEQRDSYLTKEKLGNFTSVGIRPVYLINDYSSISLEAGHALVHDNGNITVNNTTRRAGTMHLTRLTVSPALQMSKDIFARPILRVFYTYSRWNKQAQGIVGAPVYANKTDGSNIGFQVESWF